MKWLKRRVAYEWWILIGRHAEYRPDLGLDEFRTISRWKSHLWRWALAIVVLIALAICLL